MICQSTQEMNLQDVFACSGNQTKKMKKMDIIFDNLESVALAVDGSDLSITEDNFVPTARCIEDIKERQLVTRSGISSSGPRCCVCHLHHKRAMNAPAAVRQFFKPALQQVHNFKVDVISRSTKICTILQSPLC